MVKHVPVAEEKTFFPIFEIQFKCNKIHPFKLTMHRILTKISNCENHGYNHDANNFQHKQFLVVPLQSILPSVPGKPVISFFVNLDSWHFYKEFNVNGNMLYLHFYISFLLLSIIVLRCLMCVSRLIFF